MRIIKSLRITTEVKHSVKDHKETKVFKNERKFPGRKTQVLAMDRTKITRMKQMLKNPRTINETNKHF